MLAKLSLFDLDSSRSPFLAALVAAGCLGWGTLAGAQTCGGGTSSVALTFSGGFPALPTDLHPTDWGTGGVPPMSFSVPKFDPTLGTLNAIELSFHSRSVLDGCMDNPTPNCMAAQIDFAGLQVLSPSPMNVPRVTGFDHALAFGSTPVTSLGFLLGASDGFDDCAQPGVTSGAPSMGDCTPGEDHLVVSSEILSQSELIQLVGADLAPWIGPAGTQVVFDSTASNLFAGSFSPLLHLNLLAQARVWVDVTYHYCPAPTSAAVYCDCVASSPCGNNGAVGEGCANGTGQGARLSATGTDSIALDSLGLHAQQLPAAQPVLFFQGNSKLAGGAGVTFGDGLRCAGGGALRLETTVADASGQVSTSVALAAAGNVAPGDVRRYQAWYRDPQGSPCGTGFNLSNGLELTWQP